ncbi:MAG: flagellar biosynthesis protein FlhA [Treponema sp.]|nr:flagellar biosynthesis protein FlhA [Treponema sp.]
MADLAQPSAGGRTTAGILTFFKDSFPATALIVMVLSFILPLPTVILDALMAINLVFSLMVLLIVLYTNRPTEFSIFPTILLVSTVFSLALNVSSTRAILTLGARFNGRMIRAFSSFVVGTSGTEGIVVGAIIFAIIIAVQVIVITKGATRVSEVAARFTLDSMTVKMMAVENEVSSGSISEEEAQRKKDQIQKESDFYGSMDGASKFISGNVKVGVFIIVVEILGGFIIGSVMYNEQNVFTNYISLAIGDGLVTQLPALLISTAMGVVVTRAAATGSLSDQVMEQIISRPAIVYWICAGVLAFLSVLPGFPWYVLIPMAALVAFNAFRMRRVAEQAENINKTMSKTRDRSKEEKPAEIPPVVPLDVLSLDLGYGLVKLVDKEKGAELLDRVQSVRNQTGLELGLVFPKVHIQDNAMLDPSEYCFKIKNVDVGRGKIRLGFYLCIDPGTVVNKIEGEATKEPTFGLPALWIPHERRDEAERAGYTVVDPPSIIATHLTEIIRRNAANILGLQDTQDILDNLRKSYPAVIDEVLRSDGKGLRITEIQKIFIGLLRERVSIRDKITILEAVADYAQISKNIWFLTEKARQALASQICQQYADDDRKLKMLTIDRALEQKIIESKNDTPSGPVCALDPITQRAWIAAVKNAVTAVRQVEKGWMPVIICSEAARYLVRNSTDREMPDLAVLSVPELAPEVIPEAVGVIRIEDSSTEM